MDYEKAYKEALLRAKEYSEGHSIDVNPQAAMGYVFPELKESDGERERRAAIRCVEWFGADSSHFTYVTQDAVLDWLKGVENSEWKPSDDVMLNQLVSYFEDGNAVLQHDCEMYASWLKGLKRKKIKKGNATSQNID